MTSNRVMWLVLSTVGNVAFSVVVPLLIFGLGGRFIDKLVGTTPWFFVGGLFLSLGLTTLTLAHKTLALIDQVNQEEAKEDEERKRTKGV